MSWWLGTRGPGGGRRFHLRVFSFARSGSLNPGVASLRRGIATRRVYRRCRTNRMLVWREEAEGGDPVPGLVGEAAPAKYRPRPDERFDRAPNDVDHATEVSPSRKEEQRLQDSERYPGVRCDRLAMLGCAD